MSLPPPSYDPQFPRSQTVYQALHAFAEQMEHAASPSDGVLTARVIGEFSAGKTRLLRELFGDLIPPALFPVSSLERQTRLQLEITHGPAPALTLIEREHDYRPAVTLQTLDRFPERAGLAGHDPMCQRLRLTLPEPRLILPAGDGFSDDTSPKRLFLIDTPGWNSGDDALAEADAAQIMTGHHNLALVYVTNANRLDGAKNADRLSDFLQALADADFLEDPTLLFIVTHCPGADADRMALRARALVLRLWQALGREADELTLNLFCVDFGEMTEPQRQTFRDDFWQALLAPLGHKDKPADPWVAALRKWPQEWDMRPSVAQTWQCFERARQWLERARKNGEFVAGMNMYRLMGRDPASLRGRVRETWLRQLDCSAGDLAVLMAWHPQDLPEAHPLAGWWHTYWHQNCQQTLQPVRSFFRAAEEAIRTLTPKTADLQAHLNARLATPYKAATAALEHSFVLLVESARQLEREVAPEKTIATMLTLSLLQARYADYYAQHSATLAAKGQP